MDGWYRGRWRYIEHLMVLKNLWFGCRFEQRKVLSADNSTPKLERITNFLFCSALRGIQIFTREVSYFYVLSLALSGSLFLFTVYFLMQPHIRHPRRCIFTLVTFDRHFSAPHIWVLRLPA